jgi:hypothetical protein
MSDVFPANVFPANENRIDNIGIHRLVNRIARLLVRVYVIDRAIALCSISERHGNEKLMIPFAVGIHDVTIQFLELITRSCSDCL